MIDRDVHGEALLLYLSRRLGMTEGLALSRSFG